MCQRDEISEAIEECWKWNDTLSVVVLAGNQLWFYIWKKVYMLLHHNFEGLILKPTHSPITSIGVLRCYLGIEGSHERKCGTCSKLCYRVPQISILGSPLFKIYLNDLFLEIGKTNAENYEVLINMKHYITLMTSFTILQLQAWM